MNLKNMTCPKPLLSHSMIPIDQLGSGLRLLGDRAISGLPRVREKSGKLKLFQGQGIVREFCKLSGKFGNTVKCQGIFREF